MSYHIGERSTVFQAETFAVEQAAKLLKDNGNKNKTIIINCDSQAAIKTVDSTIIKSKTVEMFGPDALSLDCIASKIISRNKMLLRNT